MREESLREKTTVLLLALKARHVETCEHCQRVGKLALILGRVMKLSASELLSLQYGALLHDIGKIAVKDSAFEPRKLSNAEWQNLRSHTWIGAEMLRAAGFPEGVLRVVAEHHERWDGTGYPNGLQGEQIAIEARVCAVVDAYDAIVSDRCYRRGAPHEVAIHEIKESSGLQFDPAIVDTFIQIPRVELSAIYQDQQAFAA